MRLLRDENSVGILLNEACSLRSEGACNIGKDIDSLATLSEVAIVLSGRRLCSTTGSEEFFLRFLIPRKRFDKCSNY